MSVSSGSRGQAALERLLEANKRYVTMRQLYPRQTIYHREKLVDGQNPFAAVLSCSDSRVPSELIFDQGLGDLFIVRTAGHVISEVVLASLEFAVYALNVPLIVVLGHAQCGAVKAALDSQPLPGHLSVLAVGLQAAVAATASLSEDRVDQTIRANTRLSVEFLLANSSILAEAAAKHDLMIAAAYYDLRSGEVELV